MRMIIYIKFQTFWLDSFVLLYVDMRTDRQTGGPDKDYRYFVLRTHLKSKQAMAYYSTQYFECSIALIFIFLSN